MNNEVNCRIWLWMPSLYFVRGLTRSVIVLLMLVVFKRMGLNNGFATLFVSLFFVGWMLKPLWRPVVDTLFSRKFWVVSTQLLCALLLYATSVSIVSSNWLQSIFMLFLMFSLVSATHDVAAENYFIESLNRQSTPRIAIVQNLSEVASMLIVCGILIMVGGNLEVILRDIDKSWALVFQVLAAIILLLSIYHLTVLRSNQCDETVTYKFSVRKLRQMLSLRVVAFVRKPYFIRSLLFVVFYPLSVGLTWSIAILLFIDRSSYGGIGLSPQEFALAFGTVGTLFLALGIASGIVFIQCFRLVKSALVMSLSLVLVPLFSLFLCIELPDSLLTVGLATAFQLFLFGFGVNAYMSIVTLLSRGIHSSAHKGMYFALSTAVVIMATIVAGYWQELLGYRNFFIISALSSVSMFTVLLVYKQIKGES